MRCFAAVGFMLLLAGCSGFGHFVGDTARLNITPNAPAGDSPNLRRAEGISANAPPILAEPGDVWPEKVPQVPTLTDLAKQPLTPLPPPLGLEKTNPNSLGAQASPAPAYSPALPAPGGAVLGVPAQGILIPNGNGTSTLILPDGSVKTVPTPKQ